MNRHNILKQRCIERHKVEYKKGFCAWCKKPLKGRRTTWCSDDCWNHFYLRTDWATAKKYAIKKANGKCQKCGIDFKELWNAIKSTLKELPWQLTVCEVDHIIPVSEGGDNEPENLRALCIFCHKEETKKLRQRLKGLGR